MIDDENKYIGFEKVFSRYDNIVCVAKDTAKSFVKRYPDLEHKVQVIYNIIDEVTIRKLAKEEIDIKQNDNSWMLCSVGRLSKQKGFDMAIDVCKILKNDGYKFQWYICGEGEEKENLEKKAKEKDVVDQFILVGNQINPYSYIAKSDIYVQPSRVEGYCITLAEASIIGKPIVTTGFAGAYEQITSGVNGLIVKNDVESIANGIKKLFESKELREEFKQKINYAGNDESIFKLKKLFK